MPLSSPRLDLPYLEPAQAQKHVTHNEALRGLDLLVQLTIEEFEQTSPPALPVVGQVYALGAAPSGDWAGQPNMLALREENGWRFTQPKPGWLASQAGGDALRIWTGTAWVPVVAATDNLPGLGVNTASDPINRLAVAAPATLLSHDGGDHRLVINKAADNDTATVLFQSGWTGHAEIGLSGDTGFSVKVSPDGGDWQTALSIDPASGVVQAPYGLRANGQDVIHHGNLLGMVAQSGGAPTGAVIERGSNANGEYVRFADGTQICLVKDFNAGSVIFGGSGSFGDLYRSDTFSIIWPAAFLTSPQCVSQVRMSNNIVNAKARALLLCPAVSASPTGWGYLSVQRLSSDANADDVLVDIFACGRWF